MKHRRTTLAAAGLAIVAAVTLTAIPAYADHSASGAMNCTSGRWGFLTTNLYGQSSEHRRGGPSGVVTGAWDYRNGTATTSQGATGSQSYWAWASGNVNSHYGFCEF